ncbi:MAG: 6-chlorohydroxyquinol-1,2-dioxygenase [Chloroflexi bacterium]|nr:6-chlorohydroxyquinol-1,2-dioxygenase [Chloroflexota bacterium]
MTTTTRPGAATSAGDITSAVIASFERCPDPRLRTIMQALVRHLHAFATEVNLTEEEWAAAIQILTDTGHITDDKRQEFVLWSDALGVSMLVDALAHQSPNGATESTVLGPFWTPNAPKRAYADSIAGGNDAGTPALVRGRVLDTEGRPINGAELDIWQNGANGLYAVQDAEAEEDHLRGRFYTREDGSYAFVGVRPVPYTIPHDGPVGAMLDAAKRHPWRPAHIHMIVTAPGFQRLQTHIFDSTSAYLDSDAVFAVKSSLIREFQERSPDDPERPASIGARPWCLVDNDIVLARA